MFAKPKQACSVSDNGSGSMHATARNIIAPWPTTSALGGEQRGDRGVDSLDINRCINVRCQSSEIRMTPTNQFVLVLPIISH
jgi:hypothetical protein